MNCMYVCISCLYIFNRIIINYVRFLYNAWTQLFMNYHQQREMILAPEWDYKVRICFDVGD